MRQGKIDKKALKLKGLKDLKRSNSKEPEIENLHKAICLNCMDEVDYTVDRVEETYLVLDTQITILAHKARCKNCGQEVCIDELLEKDLDASYEKYRQQNNIITVDEIKELRIKRGLTQRELDELLGLQVGSIARYETGALPNIKVNKMFREMQQDKTRYKG